MPFLSLFSLYRSCMNGIEVATAFVLSCVCSALCRPTLTAPLLRFAPHIPLLCVCPQQQKHMHIKTQLEAFKWNCLWKMRFRAKLDSCSRTVRYRLPPSPPSTSQGAIPEAPEGLLTKKTIYTYYTSQRARWPSGKPSDSDTEWSTFGSDASSLRRDQRAGELFAVNT